MIMESFQMSKEEIIIELEETYGYKYETAGMGDHIISHVFTKTATEPIVEEFRQITIEDHRGDSDYDFNDYYIYIECDRNERNFYGERILRPGYLTKDELFLINAFIEELKKEE